MSETAGKKRLKVGLLTGCNDKHYQLGLVSGLVEHDVEVDFIGNDDMQEAAHYRNVNYFNLRGDQNSRAPLLEKMRRIIRYYYGLMCYAAKTDAQIFHIQWLNKFEVFDRTALNLFYKMLGKKLIFTAHNINDRDRDGKNTLANRLSLKVMYDLMDHIIVHTEQMKRQLMESFLITEGKITVIPHGIHDKVHQSEMTRDLARERLGVTDNKVLLFFGNVVPYKGVEYAVFAMDKLKDKYRDLRLVIAGKAKNGDEYWKNIEEMINERRLEQHILKRIEFIPDDDIEVYYKAADLAILPYTYVFQSGILFMSYNFGIPVVATDVGSLKEEVVEGETGYICRPKDPDDLARQIDRYFQSDLYRNLSVNRIRIAAFAKDKYSWISIGEKTAALYKAVV